MVREFVNSFWWLFSEVDCGGDRKSEEFHEENSSDHDCQHIFSTASDPFEIRLLQHGFWIEPYEETLGEISGDCR
jgi:hypothetical protein